MKGKIVIVAKEDGSIGVNINLRISHPADKAVLMHAMKTALEMSEKDFGTYVMMESLGFFEKNEEVVKYEN